MSGKAISIRASRSRPVGELARLQHDHVFVYRLQDSVGEPRPAIEKAALEYIKKQELEERTRWQEIEELLLMKPPFVKVLRVECLEQTEAVLCAPISRYLLCLESAVRIVSIQPVTNAFAEGKVVE